MGGRRPWNIDCRTTKKRYSVNALIKKFINHLTFRRERESGQIARARNFMRVRIPMICIRVNEEDCLSIFFLDQIITLILQIKKKREKKKEKTQKKNNNGRKLKKKKHRKSTLKNSECRSYKDL